MDEFLADKLAVAILLDTEDVAHIPDVFVDGFYATDNDVQTQLQYLTKHIAGAETKIRR